jgi:phosphate transport system substrate-binding protein
MTGTIKKKAVVLMTAAVFSASVLLTGCGETAGSNNGGESAGTLTGTVTVSGSTSVQPLAQDLSDVFKEVEPGISVEVQGGGSTQGVKDASEGTSDIGSSSRDLTEEEKGLGLTEHVIAYDGVAVVVHPSNNISNLSKDQIAAIFKGEIKNWKDVGGPDKEILVVTREDGSGTRTAFEELMKLQEKKDDKTYSLIKADALVADGTGAVKANIASKDNAIGYTSLGYVDDSMKKISIDNIECTVDTVKSKTYPVSRPFLLLTKGELRPEVKAFLDFILSAKGQEVVGETYVKAIE